MEDYIEEALAAGHICPSTSPVAAGFFFVENKDGGLRPCIDYRGLNALTVRHPYPLPLVPTALEQLQGICIFSKLDLRSAYNLIRIKDGDEWKTAFHTTQGHYKYLVMPYRLTNAPTVFQSLINEIFPDMLNQFVIAYIDDILIYSKSREEHVTHHPCHPDPDAPFVVKVDASSSGIGAVLSQCQENTGKLHPCAFYSRKLTPAEIL
ncbi:hypothetical protein QTP70_015936, partial [Hemibagrus guttatus]